MKYYFEKLQKRVDKYRNRYSSRPRKAALKLAWWNFKCIFKRFKKNLPEISKTEFPVKHDKLNIAFVLRGGIGDVIYGGIYIDAFIKHLDISSYAYCFIDQSVNTTRYLFNGMKWADKIYNVCQLDEFGRDNFELIININVEFPELSYKQEILQKSTFLKDYISGVEKFNSTTENLFEVRKMFSQQAYLLLTSKNRLSGMDVTGQLGLESDSNLRFSVPKEGDFILKKYGLLDTPFITVQRGVDVNMPTAETIRSWSVEKYNKLLAKIKNKYPNIKIVQLGVSADRCVSFENVDVNLVGKTTFAEVMALLNRSVLHIDGECGMVHVRHFLCAKPSLVLFGPTSIKNRGYKENINLRFNACKLEYCEWMFGWKWTETCPLTMKNSCKCLDKLTADMAFAKILPVLNNTK